MPSPRSALEPALLESVVAWPDDAPAAPVQDDELDIGEPAAIRPKPERVKAPAITDILSVPELSARKQSNPDEWARFRHVVSAMRDQDSRTLVTRISTTNDALTLWVLHVALDRRGIPPAQRWPQNDITSQKRYVTFLADLLWFHQHQPRHVPKYRGWRELFRHAPMSAKWHGAATRQFEFNANGLKSMAHAVGKGLALTDDHRQPLMTLPTRQMQAERRILHPERFSDLRAELLNHAHSHLDRAGKYQPDDIANRRAAMWRVYLLAGRDKKEATRVWGLLSGEPISRQALTKQLANVADAVRDKGEKWP